MGVWQERPLSTSYWSVGGSSEPCLPVLQPNGQQSNRVLGTAVKGVPRKKLGTKSGILFHGAMIRKLYCNLVLFCLFVFLNSWKIFFR